MIMKMRNMMKKKNGQKGFTLVELIVVMAILAVLAAIAVPKYGSILQDSKYKAHNANVQMIYKAGQLYVASEGNPATAITAENGISTLTTAGYLQSAPTNPYGGAAYTCAIATDGKVTVAPGLATESGGTWTVAASYTD